MLTRLNGVESVRRWASSGTAEAPVAARRKWQPVERHSCPRRPRSPSGRAARAAQALPFPRARAARALPLPALLGAPVPAARGARAPGPALLGAPLPLPPPPPLPPRSRAARALQLPASAPIPAVPRFSSPRCPSAPAPGRSSRTRQVSILASGRGPSSRSRGVGHETPSSWTPSSGTWRRHGGFCEASRGLAAPSSGKSLRTCPSAKASSGGSGAPLRWAPLWWLACEKVKWRATAAAVDR